MKVLCDTNGSKNTCNRSCRILAESLARQCLSIMELNLSSGTAYVVKSSLGTEMENKSYPWNEILQIYANNRICKEDKNNLLSLSLDKIKAAFQENAQGFSLEFRCLSESNRLDWVNLKLEPTFDGKNILLITTRDISEQHMIQKVVDLFVFQNYDYLILVDAKHNTYTRLSRSEKQTPLPSMAGGDYTRDMLLFNNMYVASEDLERVNEEMQLAKIKKELETSNCYSFSTGARTKDGQYRRTRIQFMYYDREAELILLSRMDVTGIYLEEKEKNMQLTAAMQAAQTDALTGIYNPAATRDLVKSALTNQYHNLAALLFIDVDNFKMVNDTLGHQSGDALLRFLAESLRNGFCQGSIAGRVGGDEFLLFLSAVENIDNVTQQAQKICNIFAAYAETSLHALPITCSVGIALYPQDGSDYETLVRKADQALYTSKRYGKNCHSFYSHTQ